MDAKDFIGNRAMNDYTANKPQNQLNNKKKFVEPKKVAMCLWSDSPMEVNKLKKNK